MVFVYRPTSELEVPVITFGDILKTERRLSRFGLVPDWWSEAVASIEVKTIAVHVVSLHSFSFFFSLFLDLQDAISRPKRQNHHENYGFVSFGVMSSR